MAVSLAIEREVEPVVVVSVGSSHGKGPVSSPSAEALRRSERCSISKLGVEALRERV